MKPTPPQGSKAPAWNYTAVRLNNSALKITTSYLDQRVRSGRALIHMCGVPISGQTSRGPGIRVRAVKSKRIAIMTVDIQFSHASPRGIVPTSPGIIADKRDHDSSFASLVRDSLHILSVWEIVDSTARTAVLVLRLVENDRSPIRDLALGHGSGNMGNIANQSCQHQRY